MNEEPTSHRSHYNPVTINEALGTTFLGLMCLVLLVALLRSEARHRRLLREQGKVLRSRRSSD